MKPLRLLIMSTFATVIIGITACAGTSTTESTGEYFDDTWITTKVKTALVNESDVRSAEVNVETFKGVVQLSGFVESKEAMDKAVAIAKGIQGVSSVKNDMQIK